MALFGSTENGLKCSAGRHSFGDFSHSILSLPTQMDNLKRIKLGSGICDRVFFLIEWPVVQQVPEMKMVQYLKRIYCCGDAF